MLLVVYVAFSEGFTNGIWHQLDAGHFGALLALDAVLLGCVLLATGAPSRLLRFDHADRIAIVLRGSKKRFASGLPMASVLFAGQSLGLLVLPLMLFHQLQLIASAALARRYAGALVKPLAPPRLCASPAPPPAA
jgi:solute carrier family 10 (sodium/bile acid cotransporter), member 7